MLYSYILIFNYIYHVSEKSSLLITPYNLGMKMCILKILIGGDESEVASFIWKI